MSIADGELTSMALCWRLERADGAGIALTSHDQLIVSGGVTFDPNPGMIPAAVMRSLGLEPNAGELAGALSSEALEGDLALGRWDGSTMSLDAIDWNDPDAQSIGLLAASLEASVSTVTASKRTYAVPRRGSTNRCAQRRRPSAEHSSATRTAALILRVER